MIFYGIEELLKILYVVDFYSKKTRQWYFIEDRFNVFYIYIKNNF